MNNLQQPAFPITGEPVNQLDYGIEALGFTKLEYAALMIAQGLTRFFHADAYNDKEITADATRIAKAVIEECNK